MDENTSGEQVAETPPIPEPSYQEIHDQSMRDIAAETPPVETPAPPVEETPPVVEPPVVPVIDEERAKQIAEEAAAAVIAKQTEDAKAAEAARTPEEDAYATWEKGLWEKEKRQPTYVEALNFVKEQAKSEIKAEQAEQTKAAEAERTRVQTAQTQEKAQLDTIINDGLEELYNSGKLTRIKDAANPSDQGVVERQALFARWAEVNTQRRAEGKPDILDVTRIANYYYTKPSAQPAGADAPVQGNRGSATPPSAQEEYSYQDLKKPWSFFRKS